jgi:hypothetical protein
VDDDYRERRRVLGKVVSAALFENAELRELLAQTFTPEGVEIWLRDAAKKALSLDEAKARALAAAEGTFA